MNKEFWAGIFVLSGIAVGIGVYTTVVVETAVAEYDLYKLETSNMSGIGVGTQVLMAGYDVGKISKIDVSYDPSLTFEVEMALKPEVPIPSGVVAQLGTKLAGGGVINLVPPAYIDGFLEPGSTLSLTPAQTFNLCWKVQTASSKIWQSSRREVESLLKIQNKGSNYG